LLVRARVTVIIILMMPTFFSSMLIALTDPFILPVRHLRNLLDSPRVLYQKSDKEALDVTIGENSALTKTPESPNISETFGDELKFNSPLTVLPLELGGNVGDFSTAAGELVDKPPLGRAVIVEHLGGIYEVQRAVIGDELSVESVEALEDGNVRSGDVAELVVVDLLETGRLRNWLNRQWPGSWFVFPLSLILVIPSLVVWVAGLALTVGHLSVEVNGLG